MFKTAFFLTGFCFLEPQYFSKDKKKPNFTFSTLHFNMKRPIFNFFEKAKLMMKFKLFLPILFISLASFGQNPGTADYKAHNEGWLVSMDEAIALSERTGKPIMANFTGSDWCGWCVRLTNDVFSKKEFKQWAEKNVILLEVDFPRRKQLPENIKSQNANLQQTFNVRGYPTVWVFNLKKDQANNQYQIEALGSTGYTQDVNTFTNGIDSMIKQGKK